MIDISTLFFPSDTKSRMIKSLRDCQKPRGYWCFPPQRIDESFPSVWTTAQTLWALLIFNEKPNFHKEALEIIKTTDVIKEDDIVKGWHHENIPNKYGICVTSDCIISLILSNEISFTQYPIMKLKELQIEKNGNLEGWGFLDADANSKVTPTCWALRALMYAVKEKDLLNKKIISSINCGVNWLLRAEHKNGGWGVGFRTTPRVSTTAWAIIVLLECLNFRESNPNPTIVKRSVINGINRLKELYNKDLKCWVGTLESFSSLKIEGLGSSIVLISLLKSAMMDLLAPNNKYIFYALSELKSESKGWIKPKYRETRIFDNVYWLLSLSQFQEFWLEKSIFFSKEMEKLKSKIDEMNSELFKRRSIIHKLLLIPLFSFVGILIFLLLRFWPKETLSILWALLISIFGGIIAMVLWMWPIKNIANKLLLRKYNKPNKKLNEDSQTPKSK